MGILRMAAFFFVAGIGGELFGADQQDLNTGNPRGQQEGDESSSGHLIPRKAIDSQGVARGIWVE